jgi:hypothetical protein
MWKLLYKSRPVPFPGSGRVNAAPRPVPHLERARLDVGEMQAGVATPPCEHHVASDRVRLFPFHRVASAGSCILWSNDRLPNRSSPAWLRIARFHHPHPIQHEHSEQSITAHGIVRKCWREVGPRLGQIGAIPARFPARGGGFGHRRKPPPRTIGSRGRRPAEYRRSRVHPRIRALTPRYFLGTDDLVPVLGAARVPSPRPGPRDVFACRGRHGTRNMCAPYPFSSLPPSLPGHSHAHVTPAGGGRPARGRLHPARCRAAGNRARIRRAGQLELRGSHGAGVLVEHRSGLPGLWQQLPAVSREPSRAAAASALRGVVPGACRHAFEQRARGGPADSGARGFGLADRGGGDVPVSRGALPRSTGSATRPRSTRCTSRARATGRCSRPS